MTLLEPSISDKHQNGIKLDDANNIVWVLKVGATQKTEVKVRYSVEYPKSEQLEYHED